MERERIAVEPLYGSWIVACTAGEMLGFGAAALWAWLALRLFGTDPVSLEARAGVLALMVLAGVCEGAVLAVLQWSVLRRLFPTLPLPPWIGATVFVAALGWFVGMLPSTLAAASATSSDGVEPSMLLMLLGAAMFGAVAGCAFGFAQWLVLRRHTRRAASWIWANALGWALGLPWSYVAGSAASVSESVPISVLIGALAGALMGASVALVTAQALRHMRAVCVARTLGMPHFRRDPAGPI